MPITRRSVLMGFAFAPAVSALNGRALASSSPATHTVKIKDFAFAPAELTISPGDTVEWLNLDGFLHTATSNESGGFDTGFIRTGRSAAHTFNAEDGGGEFPYHCEVYFTMKALIIVES